MEKIRSLVVAFVAMLVLGGSAFAVNVTTNTFSGLADFSSSGVAQFSFTLKNVTGNAAATRINWSTTTAFNTTSNDRWVRAEQYAVVAATVTKAGFNVYMYQTNGNSTVYRSTIPRTSVSTKTSGSAVIYSTTSVYSGLVRQGSYGGEHRGYIPIAYSFVPNIQATISYDQKTATTSATRADRFLIDVKDKDKDSGTALYPTGRVDYSMIASVCGPVFGVDTVNGPWCGNTVTNNTAYMYFFGNFKNIVGGDVYGTDQLHIVQVTE